MSNNLCRICGALGREFFRDKRTFYRCPDCHLVFCNEIPPTAEEESHYKAQWDGQDADFWRGQVDVLLAVTESYVPRPQRILDFGSGNGDLVRELVRRGFDATPFEPMIHGPLQKQRFPHRFDVVFAVEVIEHLHDVWTELRHIEKLLAPGGVAIFSTLLTNTILDRPDTMEFFAGWWYKDDPTHLGFFHNRTLGKMADLGRYDIDVIGEKVFVLRRPARV